MQFALQSPSVQWIALPLKYSVEIYPSEQPYPSGTIHSLQPEPQCPASNKSDCVIKITAKQVKILFMIYDVRNFVT